MKVPAVPVARVVITNRKEYTYRNEGGVVTLNGKRIGQMSPATETHTFIPAFSEEHCADATAAPTATSGEDASGAGNEQTFERTLRLTIPGSDKIVNVCEVQLFDGQNRPIKLFDPKLSAIRSGTKAADKAIDGSLANSHPDDCAERSTY